VKEQELKKELEKINKIKMKQGMTSLFIYSIILLLSCNQKQYMIDGYYYATTNKEIYDNIEKLQNINRNDFNKFVSISNDKFQIIKDLLTKEIYQSKSSLGTCKVNGCIVQIENKKINRIIYFSCDFVQLVVIENERYHSTILLNEKGIEKIDKLIEEL
jgi:hypothetical protein